MGIAGLLGWAVVIVVGFYIHPLAGLVLLVIAVFLYSDELMSALSSLGNTRYEEPSQLPARRVSTDIATRATEACEVIQYQKTVVTEAMTARREMEESAARELRLLIENLKADRNLSSDPEVRQIVAEFNAHQIHGTANDFNRLLKAAKAKQNELTYSIRIDDDYDY